MAPTNLALPVALLLCGFLVIGSIQSAEGNFCPMYCEAAKYMTCPSTGCKHLKPACNSNCCLAGNMEKGCIIHLSNGNVTECPKQ